ncbi:MAG: IS1 family transposase [Bdellovibrionales bacterium]|nr:IS1 family transposase [Bdellovibrionales bacterium]
MECKCPSCQSTLVKKNGRTHNGKQNHRCVACSRQFVQEPNQKIIDDNTKNLVKKALLERVSLHGICRIFDVRMPWLLELIDGLIEEIPRDLNAEIVQENDEIEVVVLQADELWSYVGAKANPQWLWLVMHSRTRQVVAMEVGPRDKATAERLFYKLPEPAKKKALCYTDYFLVYFDVIPYQQHKPVGKESGKTSYVERLNCTLRQRCSRLVRKTLSFSKKLKNHIGMIAYFIADYNLRLRALLV